MKSDIHFGRVFLCPQFHIRNSNALYHNVLDTALYLWHTHCNINRRYEITIMFNSKTKGKNGFVYNRVRNLPIERHRLLLAILQMC